MIRAILAATAALASVAGAQESELPAPSAIIQRHVEAAGGRHAFERLGNRVLKSVLRQGDSAMGLRIVQTPPCLQHARLQLPGGTVNNYVTNQEHSWIESGGQITATSGDEREQSILRASYQPMLRWRELYALSKTLGVRNVRGRDAYEVRLITEEGHRVYEHFDIETGLRVMTRQDIIQAGVRVRTEVHHLDYRETDGVLVPWRLEREISGAGRPISQVYEIEAIRHNVEIPEGLFDTPAEIQGELQSDG